MRIDLHVHSNASDGTDTPRDVVAAAAAAGLDVVALTDHDTTAGWDEARAARPDGLILVPGVEFSCVHQEQDGRHVSLHLLGYLFDPHDAALHAEWQQLRHRRRARGKTIVDKLAADGYPISWTNVHALAGDGSIGRPHIARALVDAGVMPDVDTAFRELLSSRQRYYVRKADTEVFAALRLIRAAGGVAVLAHPMARRRGPVVSDQTIADLAVAGLAGLEVDHPDQGADDRAHAAALARDLDLIATGSSDYHGANKPTRLGDFLTDPEQYERLLAMPTAARPIGP
jgi:3',5'-nucleoside bisphosphate phosphatase